MAVTQVLSLFIKHRRRSRAEQGGKAAVSVQKTPFAGKNIFVSVNEASVARGFIPAGREAAPLLMKGPAAQANGDKSPRHR
jgi:hypothetical protein